MKLTALRLPEPLIERLDQVAERISARSGIEITRSSVARMLLNLGLAQMDAEELEGREGEA
jgi:predicted DNA-binding protein